MNRSEQEVDTEISFLYQATYDRVEMLGLSLIFCLALKSSVVQQHKHQSLLFVVNKS